MRNTAIVYHVMVKPDPVQTLIQAGVYILLYAAPIVFLSWIFLYIGGQLLGSIAAFLAFALFSNFLCLRIFDGAGEGSRFNRLGLPFNGPGLRNSLTGIVLGFAAAAFVVLIPLLIGIAHETVPKGAVVNWREQLFIPFLLLAGAAGEEILFRGFGFQTLLRAFHPAAVIVPTGVVFGLLHSTNPNASWFGIVNTIGFGILFGYAFLRSHDIWFPLGLHYGWNLTLLLFGVNISGITMRVTSYEVAWSGPVLWSGGAYGPEASALTTIALVLLSAAVWKTRVIQQEAYLVDCPRSSE